MSQLSDALYRTVMWAEIEQRIAGFIANNLNRPISFGIAVEYLGDYFRAGDIRSAIACAVDDGRLSLGDDFHIGGPVKRPAVLPPTATPCS